MKNKSVAWRTVRTLAILVKKKKEKKIWKSLVMYFRYSGLATERATKRSKIFQTVKL